jgi:catechol 2,3-dioxygenase-like lactoylglutathione lyase family enzyme
MTVEVLGIDHVYLSVSDMAASESFYDTVMLQVLGYRKGESVIGGDAHVHYYNRQFGFSLRPARTDRPHDPYSPGLHHFCFRVEDNAAVDQAASELAALGVTATTPDYYPQYAADYYALFFEDPDGVRLEITNFRQERRERMERWEPSTSEAT